MIAYVYLKTTNQITSIVNDVLNITDTDVLGKVDFAKGNDFALLGVYCSSTPLTKEVEGQIVNLEIFDIIEGSLIDNSRRIRILTRLEELDKVITRPAENYIKFLMDNYNYIPYQTELDVITEKVALRLELSLL